MTWAELVPTSKINVRFPQKVIEFYEEKISVELDAR